MLPSDYHAVAPGHWFPIWHALNDAKCLVAEEVLVDILLPVDGYAGWFMTCLWCGLWINVYLDWRACHAGQYPMRAGVKG